MFEDINKLKKEYENRITLGYILIGMTFIAYLILFSLINIFAYLLIIPFFWGGIIIKRNHDNIKVLSNDFKEKYVSQELKKIFPDSQYLCYEGFSEDAVVASGLLRHRDRYKSEDMIIGHYKNINFSCSDVEQKDVRRTGKTTTVVTVFQGRFYEFDFHKPFKEDLLILQPYHFKPFSGFKKLKTESLEFNSNLKIYAKNEHEAFYILTPDFMEKIMYFDNKYLDKIYFSFIGNKMYIAIDTRKDYFDIKAFKNLDQSIFNEYRDELDDIKELIETLNLTSTLFKNE